VRSSNAARYLAVFGVDPSAQGGVQRIRVISLIPVVSRGVLFGARFSWNWICGCLHARQLWQRSDHAAGTRLFRGSDKAANIRPIALNILWEPRTPERFRTRDWRQGPFLELSIRHGRDQEDEFAASTRILFFKFHFAIARGGIWEAQAAPASGRRLSRVLGTHMGSATELFCGTERPDRSSRSVCLLGETTYVSITVG
jgi:hypothetical protein